MRAPRRLYSRKGSAPKWSPARPPGWGSAPSPDATASQQLLLQSEQFPYDRVGNPVEIRDHRNPDVWPDGAKPVTKQLRYDDLYRLTRTDFVYPGGSDKWIDPMRKEHASGPPNRNWYPVSNLTTAGRPLSQTWSFDWLGNITETDDNAHVFWDRSIGTQTHATLDVAPYQLRKLQRR
jgi:hypothetical protein